MQAPMRLAKGKKPVRTDSLGERKAGVEIACKNGNVLSGLLHKLSSPGCGSRKNTGGFKRIIFKKKP